MNPSATKWTKQPFDTSGADGRIHRVGYVCGAFAIARDTGDWLIFHLPTGMSFNYSVWPSLRDAKRFAEQLLAADRWDDRKLHQHPERFHQVCHEIADRLGGERRRMVAI